MIHNLDIEDFLNNYWQKKPLLVRNAFPDYHSPLQPEELAGLACENEVESRIIIEDPVNHKWHLETGPFSEERFTRLPQSHWTVLVQNLDKLLPEFNDLLHAFNFIPSWRVDDVMGSYAAEHGSVGPHIDQYDVFLVQGLGQRKWMIHQQAVTEEDLIPDIPLKILSDFEAEQEWILNPGDMLYLPPNVAHYGIGLRDCITYSIGFRAPSIKELLTDFIDQQAESLDDSLRYTDIPLQPGLAPGEITMETIEHVRSLMLAQFEDTDRFGDWFACFITQYLQAEHYPAESELDCHQLKSLLPQHQCLRRSAETRASYLFDSHGYIRLYINGEYFPAPKIPEKLIRLFCDQPLYPAEILQQYLENDPSIQFICELFNSGFLEFCDE